ncbi:MAG: hypothetical protein ACI8ZX_002579, partial [Planctomycetota bacterium]
MEKILLLIFSLGLNIIYAQNCNTPSAYIELDVNNIKAGLLNGGDMWWDGVSEARYTYPNDGSTTPKNIAFTGAIWLTAYDSNNNLKCSSQLYRSNGYDFWTGPIQNNGPWVDDSVCSKFDRFFEVYKAEVITHINRVNTISLPLPLSSILNNIKEWPGKGNQYLLNTYGIHIDEDLAPFEDSNNNGIYDPQNGDYPLSKGDQCIFWVINDIGSTIHTNSGGDALGVEIQCMAYAYATNNAVNDATFYDYTIIKKTPDTLFNFLFSNAIDADIGDGTDDYCDSDTLLNYGYTYNADNYDLDYEQNPPIFATLITKTPNNLGMSSFMYFIGSSGPQGEPETAIHFRNYQTFHWKNNLPITPNINGITECILGITPGDRKTVQTSGPYTLSPYTPLQFSFAAIVIPTDSTYDGCPDKTIIINPTIKFIKNYLDTVNNLALNLTFPSAISNFSKNDHLLSLYPNPTSEKLYLNLDPSFELAKIEIYDTKGAIIKAE